MKTDPTSAPPPAGDPPDTLPPAVLSQVLSLIDLGIIGLRDREERLLFCNRKACELLAMELDRPAVETIFGYSPRKARQSAASLLIGDSVVVGDRHVGFTIYDLPDGSHWIILRDVTDRLHLQRAAEGMTVANNLGYAFAGVAHELGNPINSVKMAATVLRDHFAEFSAEQQQEYLTEILSETLRMQEILRLMQSFIGIGSLELVTAELCAECRRLVELARRETEPRGIELKVLCGRRDPVLARVDPGALRQVVWNLVTNAIEAVNGRPRPAIVIDAWRGDKFAHVRVTDNGQGLSREHQERLFFPFYSTRPGGMGFGLVIVKKLVSSMGGTIEVVSALGLGTTFEMRFPLAEPSSIPPALPDP
jgi:signal transduction histidine kinase